LNNFEQAIMNYVEVAPPVEKELQETIQTGGRERQRTQGAPFRRTESRFNTNEMMKSMSQNRKPEPVKQPIDGEQTFMLGTSQFG
jgi:hypothetical protein